MRISARVDRSAFEAAFSDFYRFSTQRMERAMLIGADRGAREGLNHLRGQMVSAGLGRLGNALNVSTDLAKGRGIHRGGNDYRSASGVIFIRSTSERSRGAIEAYTQGADIRPVRGKWLWIATEEIPRLTGRRRMTPQLYKQGGFEQKIGPLVLIEGANGNPVLIIKNIGVSASGKARNAKSLRRNGVPRKGQVARESIVAFYAIPRTSRAARVDAIASFRAGAERAGAAFYEALGDI